MAESIPWGYRQRISPARLQSFATIALIVVPALVGMLFCLLNAFGADLLCLSSGCSIYSSYSLFGVSVDLIGAVAFAAIIVVSLLARAAAGWQFILYLLLLTGLVLDTLFLAWQIAFWPCTSCLFVALMFLLCLLGAYRVFPQFRTRLLYLILLLWFAAFATVSVAAGKELLLRPWSVLGPENAPVSVYFSPTCPACRTAVLAILDVPELRAQTAFYPISKSAEDLQRLAAMMEVGPEQGLRRLFDEDPSDGPPAVPWSLRWKLTRNTMAMAQLGISTVPLILTPQLILEAPPAPVIPSGSQWMPQNLFRAPTLESGCSLLADPDVPCE